MCFAGMQSQVPLSSLAGRTGKQVLLLSGLQMGDDQRSNLASRMLLDFVAGHLGGPADAEAAAQIVRVVVAGDSVARPQWEKRKGMSKGNAGAGSEAFTAIEEADALLSELVASLPVDVMPGARDPTNFTLPQQPLHPCLFKQAGRYKSLRPVTNPYHCEVEGVSFLGSSGQPVIDALRFRMPSTGGKASAAPSIAAGSCDGVQDAMDIDGKRSELGGKSPALRVLEDMLEWGHLAPTAPDTLGCIPFNMSDPFLIKEAPHVLFAGNAPRFDTSKVKGPEGEVRVVCIPSFRETSTAVLLSLDTLECMPISFHFGI